MPVRKLKPIEDRDPYARMVMEAWDNMTHTPHSHYSLTADSLGKQLDVGVAPVAAPEIGRCECDQSYGEDGWRCAACGKLINTGTDVRFAE